MTNLELEEESVMSFATATSSKCIPGLIVVDWCLFEDVENSGPWLLGWRPCSRTPHGSLEASRPASLLGARVP